MPEKRSEGGDFVIQSERHRIRSLDRVSDDGKHRLPIALGVFEALEHEYDRGVAGNASVLGKKCFDSTLMNRFAREVSGAHYRCVELSVTERAEGELESTHARELLRSKGEGRSADIELAVETVGRNIRHRTEHSLRTEERNDAFSGTLHPGVIEPQRGGPFGEAPARSIARDLGIALSAYQNAGGVARQVETFRGFARSREDHRLLTKGLLQIVRWKT
jgi:hypothetical protein